MGNCQKYYPALTFEKYPKGDIREYYTIGVILGSGSFGQVRECRHKKTGDLYAVKVMERKRGERSIGKPTNEIMIRSELKMLTDLDHPHIIKLINFFEDRYFFYVILEKCDGGELFYHIVKRRTFTEKDAAFLSSQILSALDYLHSLNIAHRDIKAENFLFKDKKSLWPLKLIDFGMSAELSSGNYLSDLCGSPHYISPELIRKKYSCTADMWAFGVLIYLMLLGRYPFEGSKPAEIAKEILNKEIDWDSEACSHLTPEARNFMKQLLERNEKKRLTAFQALRHPWICEVSLKKIQSQTIISKDKLQFARRLSLEKECFLKNNHQES